LLQPSNDVMNSPAESNKTHERIDKSFLWDKAETSPANRWLNAERSNSASQGAARHDRHLPVAGG